MNTAIMGGAGAMGGLYGAWLAKAHHNVKLVDVSHSAVDAIQQHGMTLEHFDGTRENVSVSAITHPERLGAMDLVIFQVKGRDTQRAAEAARPLVNSNTTVLTLQNGWGNTQRLQSLFGVERVVAGVSLHSGNLVAPGHVKHSGIGYTAIGELKGPTTDRIRVLADVLTATGKVNVSENIVKEIWTKLALNCSCLAACAMLRFRSGVMLELRNATELMRATLHEVVTVANAADIPLNYDATWAQIERVLAGAKQVRCSMLQDVEQGRLTEIDTINGAVVETAAQHGIPVPINQTLTWLCRCLDENLLKRASCATATVL